MCAWWEPWKEKVPVPRPGLEVGPRRTGEPGALQQQQQQPESQRKCANEPEGAPESWRPNPVQREAEPGEKGLRNRCDICVGSETQTHPSRSNSKGIHLCWKDFPKVQAETVPPSCYPHGLPQIKLPANGSEFSSTPVCPENQGGGRVGKLAWESRGR